MASVQIMFNGTGFTPEWLLYKAKNELELTMQQGQATRVMENIANLSVSLAHMTDWVFAFKPQHFQSYQNLNDVIECVKRECKEASLFFDINNEYKHGNRNPNTPSKITAQVLIYGETYDVNTDLSIKKNGKHILNTINDGKGILVMTPIIKDRAGKEFLLSDCANAAIDWWESVIK
jgi:hypothetical protein